MSGEIRVIHTHTIVLDPRTQRVLDSIVHSLARIERKLGTVIEKENQISMDIHEEIAAAVGPVLAAVSAVSNDVAAALANFANKVAPKLSDDEKAEFAGLAQQLLDLDASVKAADPGDGSTPTPEEPSAETPPAADEPASDGEVAPVDGAADTAPEA